jgi:hypothetical protein
MDEVFGRSNALKDLTVPVMADSAAKMTYTTPDPPFGSVDAVQQDPS